MPNYTFQRKKHSGILLVEILLAIAFFASIIAVGTQVTLVSVRSSTESERKDTAVRLARELLETARAASDGDWYQIYHAPHSTSSPLMATSTSGAWAVVPGIETVVLSHYTYTRSFTVASTSRDFTTRAIHEAYDAAQDDPSTQKITATVQIQNGGTVVLTEYFSRARNVICHQTDWSGGVSSGAQLCENPNAHEGTEVVPTGSFDTTSGVLKLKK